MPTITPRSTEEAAATINSIAQHTKSEFAQQPHPLGVEPPLSPVAQGSGVGAAVANAAKDAFLRSSR